MMQQPQAAPEMTTTRWAPSVLLSIQSSRDAVALDPVPMGLNCLIGSEGQTTVWAQLRSQISVRGRRLLLDTIEGETCHLREPEQHGAC